MGPLLEPSETVVGDLREHPAGTTLLSRLLCAVTTQSSLYLGMSATWSGSDPMIVHGIGRTPAPVSVGAAAFGTRTMHPRTCAVLISVDRNQWLVPDDADGR